jgi:very-short-patch-repair endonuclease
LVIEVDGDIHADQKQIVRDRHREVYLTMLGLEVIRYRNDDILNNLGGVLEDLPKRLLSNYLPSPLLTKEGDRGASR